LPRSREATPFALSAHEQGKLLVLRASGDLDLSGKARFAKVLAAIDPRRTSRLVIDLADVSFIDSTGLAMVLEAWSKCRRDRLRFAVVLGNGSARRAFEAAGLIEVVPTVERFEAQERIDSP
jgi:anti-sigma B factor antagonist